MPLPVSSILSISTTLFASIVNAPGVIVNKNVFQWTKMCIFSVAAGRWLKGGIRPGRHCAGGGIPGAKICNSEIWPLMVNWRLHCSLQTVIFYAPNTSLALPQF